MNRDVKFLKILANQIPQYIKSIMLMSKWDLPQGFKDGSISKKKKKKNQYDTPF